MASVPDSSKPGRATDQSLLEIGLAALKQGQYSDAITSLEAVVQNQPEQGVGLKAQMGLVSAYEKVGEPAKAIALCQTLSRHPNAQMKAWAMRNLATLTKRYPQAIASALETDQTGFVLLDSPPQPAARESVRQRAPLPPKQPLVQNEDSLADASPPQPEAPAADPEEIAAPASSVSVSDSAPGASTVGVTQAGFAAEVPYQPGWRQAGRAKHWNPLGKVQRSRLWLLQAATIAALFLVIWATLSLVMGKTNDILYYTRRVFPPIQAFYRDPTQFILLTLVVLVVAAPWLLDGWFKTFSGLQSLSLSKLAEYSPEASRLIPRLCQSHKIPVPKLWVLPIAEPLSLTYGCLPRFSRIVVSQGLLERLADDEIATIYACELGHVVYRDFIVLSLITIVLLIPFTMYWQLANWGDRLQRNSTTSSNGFLKFIFGFSAAILALLSALAYGAYWLFRLPTLWLARHRTYHSDRFAAEATGNPNGLTRALLKIAIGTAEEVQKKTYTSYLLEALDLLPPLGHRVAVSLGSLYPHTPLESVLQWDCTNPYSSWLAVNHSHPPMGDRLQLLSRYAQHWKLEPELDFPKQQRQPLDRNQWQTLLLQGAPFFGVGIGAAVALLFWLIGGIGGKLGISRIAWIWGDSALLFSWMLLGFGIGTILRFNSFFPDIPVSLQRATANLNSPRLPVLLKNSDTIPLNSQPIYIEGKLLGRQGMGNWLGQDLLLQTTTGIIKLHCFSQLGAIGNLLPQPVRPCELINRPIIATGWFRRSAISWVDVEGIRTTGARRWQGGHQVWSTIIFLIATVLALYILLRIGV
jgi:Zn-dependent protease with chaperone function